MWFIKAIFTIGVVFAILAGLGPIIGGLFALAFGLIKVIFVIGAAAAPLLIFGYVVWYFSFRKLDKENSNLDNKK